MDFLADAPVSSGGTAAATAVAVSDDDLPVVNLSMARGETETWDFTLAVGTDARNWSEIWFTAKHSVADPDSAALFQKKKSTNAVVVDPKGILAYNVLRVVVLPSDTSALGPYQYHLEHSLTALRTTGDDQPIFRGTLTINPTATASTTSP